MSDQFGTTCCGVGSKSSGDVIHICYMPMEKKHIPADKHYQEYGRNPHIVMSPTFAVNQPNSANCMPEIENRHHHPNCVPENECHHHHCANSVPEVEGCHKHAKDCRLDGCHCSVKCDCKCVEDVCTKYLRKELCKFIGKPIYIVIQGNFFVGLTIIITRIECGIIEGIVTSPAPWATTSQGQNSANTKENNLYEYPSMVFQICSIILFSPNYQADAYWQGQGISQSQRNTIRHIQFTPSKK